MTYYYGKEIHQAASEKLIQVRRILNRYQLAADVRKRYEKLECRLMGLLNWPYQPGILYPLDSKYISLLGLREQEEVKACGSSA